MHNLIHRFLFIIFLSLSVASLAQFKVVAYLTTWNGFTTGATNIDGNIVTHVNIAFVNPINPAGDLDPTVNMTTVVNTLHSKNVKVLGSLGGAGAYGAFPDWPTLLRHANRTAFVAKIVQYVADYNLDGIDVDLEGADVDSNYTKFITALDTTLPAGKLLTCALGTWFANKIPSSTLRKFDWVNDMAYDAYGTWTGPGEHSTYEFAETDLDYWLGRGVSKDSLVLGVPFYGYLWNGTDRSSTSYCNVLNVYPRAEFQDTIVYNNGNGFVSFNSYTTIQRKTALAIEKANGIMYWTSQFDCVSTNPKSLIQAVNTTITNTPGNIAPEVSISNPANNAVFTEADTIELEAIATDADGTITNVSFFNNTKKYGESNVSPYTANATQLSPGTYKIHAKAFDNVPVRVSSDTITIVVNPVASQQAFNGTIALPGKVESENFDIGNNLGYYDVDVNNQGGQYRSTSVDIEKTNDVGGGYDVGWTQTNEWLEYTVNVDRDSSYDFEIRIATTTANKTLNIEFDGVNVTGNVVLPNTGGWQVWQTVYVRGIALTAGTKTMRVSMMGGGFNFNYVNVTWAANTSGIFKSASSNSGFDVFPNPFSDKANIRVDLPTSGHTKVSLFNAEGKEMKVLHDAYLSEGVQYLPFNATELPAGFYICQIIQADRVVTAGVVKE